VFCISKLIAEEEEEEEEELTRYIPISGLNFSSF
jgi:hypothetical protein